MFHIVIDLEMNPISRSMKDIRKFLIDEVIEIGAVKLDENYKQISEFQCYVHPEFGQVKKHITDLTGITNEKLENQPDFTESFKKFWDWIGTWDMTLYSWGPSDIKQLKHECAYKIPGFDVKRMEKQWRDIQKDFDERLGLSNNLGLRHAIGAMDRNFEGTAHTALADASNTAAILALLQNEEEFLKTMKPVIDLLNKEELSQSIGDMYPELMNLNLDE